MKLLLGQNQVFSLSVLGEQFRERPEEFDEIKQAFSGQSSAVLKHCGYIESISEYRQILASADVVLSTALHDFQGLAVLEAVAAGCIPVLPGRLCYGEWFDEDYCYRSFVDDADREAQGVAERVIALAAAKKTATLPCTPTVTNFAWQSLKPCYQGLLTEVVAQAGSLYDSRPQYP